MKNMLHESGDLDLKNYSIVNGTDFALKEKGECVITVYSSRGGIFTIGDKDVPTLNDMFNNEWIHNRYSYLFLEEKPGMFMLEIQSENEGKKYCYDASNKVWYFVEEINSLKQEKESLEKCRREYIQAEKRFNKVQMIKGLMLLGIIVALILINLVPVAWQSLVSAATAIGGLCVPILCIDLVWSKIRFVDTGGYGYYEEKEEETNTEG